MSVIYVLLAISIFVAILFFTAFILSVRSGQYDDSYTPSVRILFEDELVDRKGGRQIGKTAHTNCQDKTKQAVNSNKQE